VDNLKPTKISSVNCLDRLNYIRDFDRNYGTGLTEQLKSSFDASPDYTEVYRNYDFSKIYKTRIFEGNEADKKLGFKYLQSYPYDPPEFRIGDYVHWKYDHVKFSTWLMISLDTQHIYNTKGRIWMCNNYLKWIDDEGKVKSYECVFMDSLTYSSFRYAESGVLQVNGTIGVFVQQNDDTREIYRNQRFLFDGIPYLCNNFVRSVNPNILELNLVETQRLDADDLENNIAYNGTKQEDIEVKTETIITPEVDSILEGDTQDFVITRYVNGVAQNDTYTFTPSGVPSENYILTTTSNNGFSVENIEEWSKNALTIECENNTTGEISIVSVWLTGGW